MLAIEQLAVEIENPFGQDDNDLPLDTYLATIIADCERLLREQRLGRDAEAREVAAAMVSAGPAGVAAV